MKGHSRSARHVADQIRSPMPGLELVSLTSDRSFPRHSHDAFGVGVLVDGGHRSWSGRGQVEAGPGDCVAVNPGEIHDGHPISGAPRRWLMVYLDPALLSACLDDPPGRDVDVAAPVFRDEAAASAIRELHRRLAEPDAPVLPIEERLVGLGRMLLTRHSTRRMPPPGPPPPIRRARDLIDDEPSRLVTLAELAAVTGLSRYQVLRGFARAFGITPHAYALQRRVGLARSLLLAGAAPADAAAAAGFADQSHLTRAFHRQFGTTPARIRASANPVLQ